MQFKNLGIVLVVLVASHLYKRYQALQSLEPNAPGKLQAVSTLPYYSIKYADQINNCEDAILLDDSDGWALLSCDAGRDHWNTVMGLFNPDRVKGQGQLHLYNYASPTASPIPLQLLDFPAARSDFHPLGIEYHPSSKTLYVVNHAVAGTRLEVFKLFLAEHSATHVHTIIHPKLHSPNSVTVIDEENLYVTNDHFFLKRYHPFLATLETYLAIPIGNVVHVHLPTMEVKRVARLPFANGVKLLNPYTLAVASTTNGVVNLYNIDAGTHSLKFNQAITVPFLPDNLSVDAKGRLLIAGHGHAASIEKFAKTRALCRNGSGAEAAEACKLTSPSYVAEWTEYGGLRTLYLDDKFSTSTTAVRDTKNGVGIITGLFADGILVWKE